MYQRYRERLTILLLVLLPFHAFGVTVLTRLFAGPGHPPLAVLAIWKEAVIVVLLLLALAEIITNPVLRLRALQFDAVDRLAGLFFVVALLVSGLMFSSPGPLLHGAKYDLLPLVLLVILKRVPWSLFFARAVLRVIVAAGVMVAVLGLAGLVLPQSTFAWLGYSDLHSLYVPGGPLAPFQQLGGSTLRRMQSVMSGPNQLGIWLLIPLVAAWVVMIRGVARRPSIQKMTILLLLSTCLAFTFSRSAWMGVVVMVVAGAWWLLPVRQSRRALHVIGIASGILIILLVLFRPPALLRLASSRDHLLRPLHALQVMADHPLGMGLGTAGPASNRFSDACVDLEAGADASWAAAHPQLCVFVGGTQVQPAGRTCACPLLPENWYLQIGIETGVLGLLLFLGVLLAVAHALLLRRNESPVTVPAALALLGVAVAGLFLHAFEDAAVAYTVWTLVAVALSSQAGAKGVR